MSNILTNNTGAFIKPPVSAPTAVFSYVEPREGFLHVYWTVSVSNVTPNVGYHQFYSQTGVLIAEMKEG